MKRELKWTAVAAVLVMSLGAASAQTPARTDRADGFSQSLPYPDYLKGRDVRASELVGERLRNADGESLGEIEELVIPTRGRDDMLVILSVGGVLDLGDKLVALPYHDLRVSADGGTLYIDRTEEQLEAAPAFAYDADAHADAGTQAGSTQRAPGAADRTASTTPNASATAAKADNVVLDVFDHRASDLIGAAVLDDRGENVGKLDDIVVSTDDDKLHAVIAIGGFAGFGAKRISLPLDDLQITATDRPQVRIPMTGEQLQRLVDSRGEFRYERQVARAPADAPRG
jgi:sporulation protein YlmC with PRC-barrel domain